MSEKKKFEVKLKRHVSDDGADQKQFLIFAGGDTLQQKFGNRWRHIGYVPAKADATITWTHAANDVPEPFRNDIEKEVAELLKAELKVEEVNVVSGNVPVKLPPGIKPDISEMFKAS